MFTPTSPAYAYAYAYGDEFTCSLPAIPTRFGMLHVGSAAFFINRLNFLLIPSLSLSLCWGLFLLRNNSPIYIKFRTFIVFKSHP
ncbi:hypothetical protein ACPD0L_002969, partial [Vibrio cholerae]